MSTTDEELIRGLLRDALDIAVTLDGRLMKERLFYSKFQFCREKHATAAFFSMRGAMSYGKYTAQTQDV